MVESAGAIFFRKTEDRGDRVAHFQMLRGIWTKETGLTEASKDKTGTIIPSLLLLIISTGKAKVSRIHDMSPDDAGEEIPTQRRI